MSISYDNKDIFISVVITALNEEGNIVGAITNILKAFDDFGIKGELIVVNDGSTDNTGGLIRGMIEKDARVRMFVHDVPKGVGASFWDGVDLAEGNVIVWFPGDNENDPGEIFRYHKLLDDVDIVIPFIFNKEVRPCLRNFLSYLYCFIINVTFMVSFNYTNGTNLYRRSILKEMDYRCSGFFYQTDIVVRAVKKGYLFAEVPCRLAARNKGMSKAISVKSLWSVIKDYLRLFVCYYFQRKDVKLRRFAEDSVTALRLG